MRTPAIVIIWATILSVHASSVAAQSFEQRWSIIPKAHADEPPKVDQPSSPAPPAQSPSESTAPQPQSDVAAKPTRPQPQSDVAAKPTRAAHEHSASDGAAKPARRAHDHLGRASRRTFSGQASFYAYQSGKTASGSAFNREARTAAHRHLPFGTKLRVTNVANQKSVVVTITDRGPHKPHRVLDLSLRAARDLGIIDRGVAEVRAEVL
jgi:rare lipoprotein A